jgi:hypothetical protein
MRHATTKTRALWAMAVMLGALLVILGVAGSGNLPPPPSH